MQPYHNKFHGLQFITVPVLILCTVFSGLLHAQEIRVSNVYPTYFEYKGEPVLLLGGSVEDNLFQIEGLQEHLDLLVASGGNYVRNTMSSRDSGNLWAFHRQEDGIYDLARWNDDYWQRFETFLNACEERDIIVQIEVWATFDFYRDVWDINPFNPKNNRNYDSARTRLPHAVPTHPTYRGNPFFWSVPQMDNNARLIQFQQRFVDKLLSYSLNHGNVLYCMDNETSVTATWGRFWADYIRTRAFLEGKQVQTTEMWDAWDLSHPQHFETMYHPETYSFVDISQNNHQTGDAHWENGLAQIRRLEKLGYLRPMTNVKVYGNDGGRHKTTQQGTEAFIRNVFLGCASSRFHRPTSGQGLNERAQNVIRSLRDLSLRMNVFEALPYNGILENRQPEEAYCMAVTGGEYAVYFPNGGSVDLDLSAISGGATLEWCDVLHAKWSESEEIKISGSLVLECPGAGHWIALIKAGQQ
jgi:hypothetical protein